MTQLEAELKSRLLDLDARVHTLEACLRFNGFITSPDYAAPVSTMTQTVSKTFDLENK